MLCPEVWKFPNNQKKLSHKFGCYDNKSKHALDQTLIASPFNSMVSLILPGLETIPETLRQIIETSDYYLIRNLKLSELVRKDFIDVFIKQGKLTGTSLSDRHINNHEDIYLISPEGKLTLLINRELYQTIGLEGHPTEYSKRSKDRFEITIDLKKEKISEESKSYKRIQNALQRAEITVDFYLYWDPTDSSVCPSTVAKFFNDNNYEVEQHSLRLLSVLRDDLRLPNEIFSQKGIDFDLINTLVEYLSMLMLSCDVKNVPEELNSFKVDPDLNIQDQPESKAVILHCRGLITSKFISKLTQAARQSVAPDALIFNVRGYDKTSRTGFKSYITLCSDKKYLVLKA